ncbi:hypothetical protein [Oscillatoria sp. FACHB-1406]|uniref:hypothetical protein n=1 Tax=Oscillatoria sp. FACHB-1406 TaxID=2692846 RepID=UPI001687A50A|nr:hypothetical protein [Oscillatoria sp. FACHB-1406]MBD2576166.1 hypothetical protein [Oscillatoria sp. FACHB-1406]
MRKLTLRIQNTAIALAIALCGCIAPNFSPSSPNSAAIVPRPSDRGPFLNLQPADIPQKLQNPWTPELEAEFEQRALAIIQLYSNPKTYGNTTQENEKRSYPRAMFDFLAGNKERAIAFLQQEDSQTPEHAHTDGIDYYFSFTLKGQIRKYFLFGSFLNPAYKQRMFDGAKKWTERDPLERPHPLYGNGDGSGQDWSIQRRGLWVDGRNTDNLRAMRETSVYLMAEETGNEAVRQLYKQKIQRYVWALYHIGMGEWDSENYHSHTFAPYLNLYDFAKDSEVKAIAKAALDWMSTAAALKYRRGGWGGPTKRDYGGANVVYGSSAARTFDLYFGDVPQPNPEPELDTLYMITSRYRPPLAVVALARKQFKQPVEMMATKPIYENWKQDGEDKPAYWETQFFGRTYQMGSVVSGFADGDVGPFKIMANNSQRGVDFFVANTGEEGVKPGKNPGDQIGQFRNLLIWLRPANRPFFFQLPKTAKMEIEEGIWFVRLEKVAIAIRPIQLNDYTDVPIPEKKATRGYGAERWIKATPKGQELAGFALETGDLVEGNDYARFKEAVKRKGELNLARLKEGTVGLKGSDSNTLNLTWRALEQLPIIERNGEVYDWLQHFDLYRVVSGPSIVSLGWKVGTLKVEAGGHTFSTAVTGDGKVSTAE